MVLFTEWNNVKNNTNILKDFIPKAKKMDLEPYDLTHDFMRGNFKQINSMELAHIQIQTGSLTQASLSITRNKVLVSSLKMELNMGYGLEYE